MHTGSIVCRILVYPLIKADSSYQGLIFPWGLGFCCCGHVTHFICQVSSPHAWGLVVITCCLTIGSGHVLGPHKLPVDLQQMAAMWKCLAGMQESGKQPGATVRSPSFTIPGRSAVLPRAQCAYTLLIFYMHTSLLSSPQAHVKFV